MVLPCLVNWGALVAMKTWARVAGASPTAAENVKDLGPLAMNRMPPMRSIVLLATFTNRKPPSWYSVPFFVV